jgi:hypothetical protein
VRLALALVATAAACSPAAAPVPPATVPTTTTAPPSPPPTVPAVAATAPPSSVSPFGAARAGVAAEVTTTSVAVVAATPDDAFWRRLADCECASGACGGAHVSYFQFSRDTARKVGIDGSEPYEEQRAAAQEWARRIHPNEGTRSGWPVCWWRAAA